MRARALDQIVMLVAPVRARLEGLGIGQLFVAASLIGGAQVGVVK